MDLAFLEEVGLLQEVNGELGVDLKTDPDGRCVLANGDRFLRMMFSPGHPRRLELIKITRAGREIASILPEEAADVALRAVADGLQEAAVSIELCVARPRYPHGPADLVSYEQLK